MLSDEALYLEWKSEYYDYHIEIKQIERNAVKEADRLRTEYQSKIKAMHDRNDKLKLDIFKLKPLLAINYITVQSLPISITAETLSMDDESRKLRLVELLSEYKNKLYKDFKEGIINESDIHNLLLTD